MSPRIVARGPRALAIGDARGLHDGGVVAHIVDDADEAVVEHGDWVVEPRLEPRGHGAAGFAHSRAGGVDFGLLFGRQRHIIHQRSLGRPPRASDSRGRDMWWRTE